MRAARSNVWQFTKHYAYGCFATSFNGAIAALYGYIAIAVGSTVDPTHIAAPSWHTIWFFFAVRFAMDALGYFKAHPLPESLETSAPFAEAPKPLP